MYIVALGLLVILSLTNLSARKNKYLFPLITSGLVAFRSVNSLDTIEYKILFDSIVIGDLNWNILGYEPAFVLLTYLSKCFFDDFTFYLFVCALIPNILCMFSILKIPNAKNDLRYASLYYLLYFSFFGFFYSSIVLRQGIALSIIYWVIIDYRDKGSSLTKKNILWYITLLAIAPLFHYSAVLLVVVLLTFLFPKTLLPQSYKIVIFLCLLILFSGVSVYFVSNTGASLLGTISDVNSLSKYEYYSKDLDNLAHNIPFRLLFQILIAVILLRIPASNIGYYHMYNIYISGIIISCLFSSIAEIFRLADYFLLSGVFLQIEYLAFRIYNYHKRVLILLSWIFIFFVFFIRI